MAEKEERILCIETYEKIAECGYGDFYNTITRKEAIRKMCDAYFKAKDKGLMESERVVAALNALLEGK